MPDLLGDDEEFTELHSAQFSRVDLVGAPANGSTSFLVMKQDAEAGLLEPDFVRDLIAKAEPEHEPRERVQIPGGITLNGSPADIAAFIHKAAQRASEAGPGDVAKAKNDTADRKHKAATGAAMPDGSYPIADRGDLGKAIHAVGRGGSSHDAIRKHIISRARSLGASGEIPDNWAADGSLKEASVSKTEVAKDMGPELDDGVDQMDPTVPLCAPDDDAPGDPTDPGSPAWEAIDAATACKWTSILARARVAVDLLAEREMLEAATGDDGDMCNAMDLQDVCAAIDYAIGTLAPFAVAEQSAADCGEADMMAMVGKSADTWTGLAAVRKAMESADLADPLAKIEGLGWVRKAGRVLSSVNEAHIREAAGRLNTVLQSLPQAPTADDGQPVAKEQETTMANETSVSGGSIGFTADPSAAGVTVTKDAMSPEQQAKDTGPINAGGTTGMGQPRVTGPDAALPGDGPQATLPGDAQTPGRMVIKADGEGKTPMMVVYNQAGKLVGICDPTDITPVANAEADADDDMDSADPDGDGMDAAPPADASTDMTPQPPAAAGTPADAVADDVAKSGELMLSATNHLMSPDALESIIAKAVAAALGAQAPAEDIAKQADVAGLLEQVETLKARLATVEEQPAAPKVFTNGQLPPQHQMRGQNEGTAPGQVDVAKALDLKHEMYTADPKRAKEIHDDMSALAREQLAQIHRR